MCTITTSRENHRDKCRIRLPLTQCCIKLLMTNFDDQVALCNGVGLLDQDSLDFARNWGGNNGFHLVEGVIEDESFGQ